LIPIQFDFLQEGIENLIQGIANFFNYYSKIVHDKDRLGNFNPIVVARKEDAYFAYSMAVGLINLLAHGSHG
jgi:hypothetical protein